MNFVTFEKVGLSKKDRVLLSNIDWNIQEGERWVLFGPNGSGKSLLLKILMGYERASVGRVYYFKDKTPRPDKRKLRQQVGYLNSFLADKISFSESVMDVILGGAFGSIGLYDIPSESDLDKVLDFLKQFGLLYLKKRRFHTLSDGEKMKILLIRALMTSPRLLTLDEPCNGLDLSARESFLELLSVLNKRDPSLTLVYVTHHTEEVIPLFEKVLLLKDSKVLAKGKVEDIFCKDLLFQLFERKVELLTKNGRFWTLCE